ncbi:MAG: hypothetical protein MJ181_06970 [Treponema sp.]|nr:hypothetical protein [Treponema sp.]
MKKLLSSVLTVLILGIMTSCGTTTTTASKEASINAPVSPSDLPTKRDLKKVIAIARFTNSSKAAKGAFYNKGDSIIDAANDILAGRLQATNKFILLETEAFDLIQAEREAANEDLLQKSLAQYILVGSITSIGRKTEGTSVILGHTKEQIAEATVAIRLIDTTTGQVIYSEEGAGVSENYTETFLGIGRRASYDATLEDKAVAAAIDSLINNIVDTCLDNPWKSALASDGSDVFLFGGASQGVSEGDEFAVYEKGKKIKNPQTGLMMELPGKKVGSATVTMVFPADLPQNEVSLVDINGKIDLTKIDDYIVREE